MPDFAKSRDGCRGSSPSPAESLHDSRPLALGSGLRDLSQPPKSPAEYARSKRTRPLDLSPRRTQFPESCWSQEPDTAAKRRKLSAAAQSAFPLRQPAASATPLASPAAAAPRRRPAPAAPKVNVMARFAAGPRAPPFPARLAAPVGLSRSICQNSAWRNFLTFLLKDEGGRRILPPGPRQSA